jgi:hypothetical protein
MCQTQDFAPTERKIKYLKKQEEKPTPEGVEI